MRPQDKAQEVSALKRKFRTQAREMVAAVAAEEIAFQLLVYQHRVNQLTEEVARLKLAASFRSDPDRANGSGW
jgi:hypothetical protein